MTFANAANDGYGPEPGKPVAADITSSDVPSDTTHTYSINWGDGSTTTGTYDPLNLPTHTYAADGIYKPVVTLTDDEGAASAPFRGSVNVNDVPVLTGLPTSVSIKEGGSVSFTGTVVDKSGDTPAPTIKYSWTDAEHNDANAVTGTVDTANYQAALTHRFDEEGTFTETFTPVDTTGLVGRPVTVTVTVEAVPPHLTSTSLTNTDGSAIGPAGVLVGRAVKLSALFTDPGADPDVLSVDWGDGTTSSRPTTARGGWFTHTWTSDGTKDVVVTVTDDHDNGVPASITIPVTVSSPTDVAATVVQSLTQLQSTVDPTTASEIQNVISILDNSGNGSFVGSIDNNTPRRAATQLRNAIVDLVALQGQGVVDVRPEIASLMDVFGFWAGTVVDQAVTNGTASPKQVKVANADLAAATSAAASGDATDAAYLYRDAVAEVSKT